MIIYDIFGNSAYVDSKTLKRVDSIALKEIKRAVAFFDDIFYCMGYFIDFSRKHISLISEAGYTEVSINGRHLYNNEDNISLKVLKNVCDDEIIFLIPEVTEAGELKIKLKGLNSKTRRTVPLKLLKWIPSTDEYKVYKRKYLLRNNGGNEK